MGKPWPRGLVVEVDAVYIGFGHGCSLQGLVGVDGIRGEGRGARGEGGGMCLNPRSLPVLRGLRF